MGRYFFAIIVFFTALIVQAQETDSVIYIYDTVYTTQIDTIFEKVNDTIYEQKHYILDFSTGLSFYYLYNPVSDNKAIPENSLKKSFGLIAGIPFNVRYNFLLFETGLLFQKLNYDLNILYTTNKSYSNTIQVIDTLDIFYAVTDDGIETRVVTKKFDTILVNTVSINRDLSVRNKYLLAGMPLFISYSYSHDLFNFNVGSGVYLWKNCLAWRNNILYKNNNIINENTIKTNNLLLNPALKASVSINLNKRIMFNTGFIFAFLKNSLYKNEEIGIKYRENSFSFSLLYKIQ